MWEKILGFLLLGVFYGIDIIMSALFISLSIRSFKDEKYFLFGVDVMCALWYAVSLVELMIKI